MSVGSLSPDTHSAADVVRLLELQPLDQEGGWFRRTAESVELLSGSTRKLYSVIYMLITPTGFSALHRLKADEVWCFHAGDALDSLRLRPDGTGGWVRLGLNLTAREIPQDRVPAQTWQGTRLVSGGRWALISCVVAPEFWWEDFELGECEALTTAYPAFAHGILALTRKKPPVGTK